MSVRLSDGKKKSQLQHSLGEIRTWQKAWMDKHYGQCFNTSANQNNVVDLICPLVTKNVPIFWWQFPEGQDERTNL